MVLFRNAVAARTQRWRTVPRLLIGGMEEKSIRPQSRKGLSARGRPVLEPALMLMESRNIRFCAMQNCPVGPYGLRVPGASSSKRFSSARQTILAPRVGVWALRLSRFPSTANCQDLERHYWLRFRFVGDSLATCRLLLLGSVSSRQTRGKRLALTSLPRGNNIWRWRVLRLSCSCWRRLTMTPRPLAAPWKPRREAICLLLTASPAFPTIGVSRADMITAEQVVHSMPQTYSDSVLTFSKRSDVEFQLRSLSARHQLQRQAR